jgi:pentatricopeptide repeat protein
MDGLHRTVDWYFKTKNVDEVRKIFKRMLTER